MYSAPPVFSVDTPTEHQFEHLTLKANGTYDFKQDGSTKVTSPKIGLLSVIPCVPPEVQLDHVGYSIHRSKGELRLVINDDLGEWYLKVK
jgi:hypothetical protein